MCFYSPLKPWARRLALAFALGLLLSGVLALVRPPLPVPAAPPAETGLPLATEVLEPFDEVVAGLAPSAGLFTLYRNADGTEALLEVPSEQLNQNLLLVATLESGVGEGGLFRGWPINDLVIQFRLAPGQQLQVVVPNVFFQQAATTAQERQLAQQSFSDSVLAALPIISIHPQTGALLVDLNALLLDQDLANLSQRFGNILGRYTLDPTTTYLGETRLFPENLEAEVVLGFFGGEADSPFAPRLETVPDDRAFSLRVRYSLSALRGHASFVPRLADERVGYFVSALRAPAGDRTAQPFIRHIQRWHLEKRDPTAAISAPKEPIVFWLENTVPPAYRQAIREGAELWNVAFEQAGFRRALEVRQMPANADWDPADVRYNVIRWSDSFSPWAIGLGPARVNPLTGEILDADVVLDAGVVASLTEEYQTLVRGSALPEQDWLCGHPQQDAYLRWQAGLPLDWPQDVAVVGHRGQRPPVDAAHHCAGLVAAQTAAFGTLAIDTLGPPFETAAAKDLYVQQFLRLLTAHEIGHVLGLRHNFSGSTLHSPAELEDSDLIRAQGMVSSVMDYLPANLAPVDRPQGDYFPTRLGPYDRWAIEYGYKPLSNLMTVRQDLREIASRSIAPELAYSTDEDTFDILDPTANPWDLSSDPLGYAETQMAQAQAIWQQLNWFSVDPGEGYGSLRQRVDLVFGHYLRQALIVSNYIGGQRFSRVDPWNSGGQRPFQPVDGNDQRRALRVLRDQVFAADAVSLSPELVSLLAPDRWLHQGQTTTVYPLDYPLYDRVLELQAIVLTNVLDSWRLARLRDSVGENIGRDTTPAVSLAELFGELYQAIWSELVADDAPVDISSQRRGLQRYYLALLTELVQPSPDPTINSFLDFLAVFTARSAPADARALARYYLGQLQNTVAHHLRRHRASLALETQIHLEDLQAQLGDLLAAR